MEDGVCIAMEKKEKITRADLIEPTMRFKPQGSALPPDKSSSYEQEQLEAIRIIAQRQVTMCIQYKGIHNRLRLASTHLSDVQNDIDACIEEMSEIHDNMQETNNLLHALTSTNRSSANDTAKAVIELHETCNTAEIDNSIKKIFKYSITD